MFIQDYDLAEHLRFPGKYADQISSLLSEYGSQSPGEMIADTFAEYRLAGQPRDFARTIGEWIDKYYLGR